MKIEANADEGVFYPVRVVDVDMDNGLTVEYEDNWRPVEVLPFEKCRLLVSEKKEPSKVGASVEALIKGSKTPKDVKGGEGWRLVTVAEIKVYTFFKIFIQLL
ncbi:hypothetical protein WR25_07921 [Diploscapter pachys]|uniref:Agenet-like domain-containing protein n=1 Tax=Diploscapter pachys TaxID=2018661 RepID=A0A2A2J8I6_9BILA|nr:hypothetical protein WR25_07921 [Diploscapter pachys]